MSAVENELRERIRTLESQNAFYADRLHSRDMADAEAKQAEAAKPPPASTLRLRRAQESSERTLANPEALEELRQLAWGEKGSGGGWTPPPAAGWPKGVDPTAFVHLYNELTPDGKGWLNGPEPEAPPSKTLTFLDALAAEGN
jgi:hypothetical protein